MTAKQVQIRRDTATNLNAATPTIGELGYDSTNKRLIVGDGATLGGIKLASAKDTQNNSFTYSTVGGTANAITLTNTPPATAYTAGQRWIFKATSSSNSAVTVNIDSIGSRNVKFMYSGALTSLDATNKIVAGGIYELLDDGAQLQIRGLEPPIPTPSGLVYLGSRTAAASAQLDFTSLLSSTYDDYVIKFDNIQPATSGATFQLQYSNNNGSSFIASNYGYALSLNNTTGGSSTSNNASTTAIQITPPLTNAADRGCSGTVEIFNVNSTTTGKHVTGLSTSIGTSGGAHIISGVLAGTLDGVTAIDALRLKMSTGNITAGKARLYGISKT